MCEDVECGHSSCWPMGRASVGSGARANPAPSGNARASTERSVPFAAWSFGVGAVAWQQGVHTIPRLRADGVMTKWPKVPDPASRLLLLELGRMLRTKNHPHKSLRQDLGPRIKNVRGPPAIPLGPGEAAVPHLLIQPPKTIRRSSGGNADGSVTKHRFQGTGSRIYTFPKRAPIYTRVVRHFQGSSKRTDHLALLRTLGAE